MTVQLSHFEGGVSVNPSPRTAALSPSSCTKPVHAERGFRFFLPESQQPSITPPATPLRLVVVTSVRDIGLDDRIGSTVDIKDPHSNRAERHYMKGVIESLLEASYSDFGRFVQIAGVIVDDVPIKDKVEENGYRVLPHYASYDADDSRWLVPGNLQSACGRSVESLVHHVPSTFRKISKQFPSERQIQKRLWEERLESVCAELQADIILSDHLIARLEDLHLSKSFRGRVLNIHPGITLAEDPNQCRGLTPTKDAIERAKQDASRGAVFYTGASLHMISSEIDAGDVICDAAKTFVHPDIDSVTLRAQNYACSKVPVVIEGLMHFAANKDRFDRHFR